MAISLPLATLSWIGVLDSGTMGSLDDAMRSLDQYNLSVLPNEPRMLSAQVFHRRQVKNLQPFAAPNITFDFPELPDCATVAVALSHGDSLRMCHDHNYSADWC